MLPKSRCCRNVTGSQIYVTFIFPDKAAQLFLECDSALRHSRRIRNYPAFGEVSFACSFTSDLNCDLAEHDTSSKRTLVFTRQRNL